MSQRLQLLKRLQDVNLSPEEAEGLLERVTNNDANAEDRDRLAQVIRTTTQVSEALLQTSPWREEGGWKRPSPARQAKCQRQLAKAARRRHRR
jgi:hypothetical protein